VVMIDVPTSRQRDRRFDDGEETRLLAAADPWTKDLIVAALETGCRGGELRSLPWRDVQGDAIVLTAGKTKTKRKRLIPISPTLRKMLDRRKVGPDGVELLPDAHVFGNAVGEPVSRRLANRWWAGRRPERRRRSMTCISMTCATSSGPSYSKPEANSTRCRRHSVTRTSR